MAFINWPAYSPMTADEVLKYLGLPKQHARTPGARRHFHTSEWKSYVGRVKPRVLYPHESKPHASVPAPSLAQRYGFPVPVKEDTKVAVIALGGGALAADHVAFCTQYQLAVPAVRYFTLGDARNNYTGNPDSADAENALDVQTVLGASAGKVGVDVYFAPNGAGGIVAACQAILNSARSGVPYAAVSLSWGMAERNWSTTDRASIDAALKALADFGIPLFCASGDDGSSDGLTGNNTDYPASSPYAIGCGGTSLAGAEEVAWDHGGGGYSGYYGAPWYQGSVTSKVQRLVPDVAGSADPNAGVTVSLNGRWLTLGGTSAVAPLWAAFVACCVSVGGRKLTGLAPFLYALRAKFTDITKGSNGAYQAAVGPDPCTGLGTPTRALTDALLAAPPAPPPQPPKVTPGPLHHVVGYDLLGAPLWTSLVSKEIFNGTAA